MELNQLSCCGIFELSNIGENEEWLEEEGIYNPDTNEYENNSLSRPQALRACKRALRDELSGVEPRGRLVFATTVAGMSIAQEALRSLHFRVTKRFRNGNTGNRITLWMKHVR